MVMKVNKKDELLKKAKTRNHIVEYLNTSVLDFAMEANAMIVIDANCQGIFETSPQQRDFKRNFPLSYKWFLEECMLGRIYPGECVLQEENGFPIAMLVTSNAIAGIKKSSKIAVDHYTEEALKQLFEYIGDQPEEIIACAIMNKYSGWAETHNTIKLLCEAHCFKNWVVCVR